MPLRRPTILATTLAVALRSRPRRAERSAGSAFIHRRVDDLDREFPGLFEAILAAASTRWRPGIECGRRALAGVTGQVRSTQRPAAATPTSSSSHSPENGGGGLRRRGIWRSRASPRDDNNDFVVVGPRDDPAGVSGTSDAPAGGSGRDRAGAGPPSPRAATSPGRTRRARALGGGGRRGARGFRGIARSRPGHGRDAEHGPPRCPPTR